MASNKITMIAILHNIRSLHNVGSMFRTADGAGVEKIYLTGITPAPVDEFGHSRPQLTKVSLGAEKFVPWDNTARSPKAINKLFEKLKKDGYKIFALEINKKSVPYHKITTSSQDQGSCEDNKLALVVGNEVRGLSPSILKKCDRILEIPMRGKKESLNVAVAFGIAVYHFCHCEVAEGDRGNPC